MRMQNLDPYSYPQPNLWLWGVSVPSQQRPSSRPSLLLEPIWEVFRHFQIRKWQGVEATGELTEQKLGHNQGWTMFKERLNMKNGWTLKEVERPHEDL